MQVCERNERERESEPRPIWPHHRLLTVFALVDCRIRARCQPQLRIGQGGGERESLITSFQEPCARNFHSVQKPRRHDWHQSRLGTRDFKSAYTHTHTHKKTQLMKKTTKPETNRHDTTALSSSCTQPSFPFPVLSACFMSAVPVSQKEKKKHTHTTLLSCSKK